MIRFVFAVIILFMAVTVSSAKDLETYKATYEEKMKAIVVGHGVEINQLRQDYAKALDVLLAKAQKAGDLDGTRATMAEIKRFSEQQTMLDTTSSFAGLRETQLLHKRKTQSLQRAKAKKSLLLASKYDGALAKLQAYLTKQDRLEEAILVSQERKAISRADAVIKSKAILASHKQAEKEAAAQNRQSRQRKLIGHGRQSAAIYVSADDRFEMYLNGKLILEVEKMGNQLFSKKTTLRSGDVLTVKATNTKGYGAFGALILTKRYNLMLPSTIDTWKTYTPTDENRWYLANNIGETKMPVLATKDGWPRDHIKKECDVYIDNLWGAEDLKVHYFTYTVQFEDFTSMSNL